MSCRVVSGRVISRQVRSVGMDRSGSGSNKSVWMGLTRRDWVWLGRIRLSRVEMRRVGLGWEGLAWSIKAGLSLVDSDRVGFDHLRYS